MSMQTLAIIICCLFGVVLFAGVFILTYISGKLSVKNNPNKALVLLDTGSNIRTFKADIVARGGKGALYKFGEKITMLPKTYAEKYYKGRRLVFLNTANQLVSTPFGDDIALAKEERENLIYELVESKIGADSIRALKGKSTKGILLIAVIAFIVGCVIMFGFNYMQDLSKAQQPTPPNQTQQPQAPASGKVDIIER